METLKIEPGSSIEPIMPDPIATILKQNAQIMEMNMQILMLATTVQYVIKPEEKDD